MRSPIGSGPALGDEPSAESSSAAGGLDAGARALARAPADVPTDAAAAIGGGGGPGLVSTETKATRRGQADSDRAGSGAELSEWQRWVEGAVIEADPVKMRVKRMRRVILTSARYLEADQRAEGAAVPLAVTLTYRKAGEWEPRHMRAFMKRVGAWAARRAIRRLRYIWVAEIQERRYSRTGEAVVHYHAVIWLPASQARHFPFPDSNGWWPHGWSRVEACRCGAAYAAKYASKSGEAGAFPKGLRLFGAGGLGPVRRRMLRWWLAPTYVRQLGGCEHRWRRQRGGGWVSQLTGESVRSRYRWGGLRGGKLYFVRDDAILLFDASSIRVERRF